MMEFRVLRDKMVKLVQMVRLVLKAQMEQLVQLVQLDTVGKWVQQAILV
jgi:hypothetical protein